MNYDIVQLVARLHRLIVTWLLESEGSMRWDYDRCANSNRKVKPGEGGDKCVLIIVNGPDISVSMRHGGT